ncbi:MAG: helix-turn-helix transcriptional regulator [Candidatus Heimdallarchaeum aukensis]|uniref:Helix-turn-helix transcriptional regulator n=1 Tax=Candidatus Heimdallarchaeum aukensis TaxID=2876573 RepID=A0A9Y1BLF7_9ARCH|nr:MAG: helix-turn-helix transcriptional regulator [Candidatus Heimdallarchaeum aukensis]
MDALFAINWLGLEILTILKNSNVPLYKSEIIHIIRTKYPSLGNKPDSSFYAIFERLKQEKLIKDEQIKGQGYRSYLSITEYGKKQIGFMLNWSLGALIEGVSKKMAIELNNDCKKQMKCSKDLTFGTISSGNQQFLIPTLCTKCVNAGPKEKFSRYNILMPEAHETAIDSYQNIRAKYDEIPLKDNLLDRFLSTLNLGLLNDEDSIEFLHETKRILKKGGRAGFFEFKFFESYIVDAIETETKGFSFYFAKTIKERKLRKFKKEELEELFFKVFEKENVKIKDFKEFYFVIATK